MGSHSRGGNFAFVRSVIRWFLPWVLIIGVVLFAAVAAADLGLDAADTSESPAPAEDLPDDVSPEPELPDPEPSPTPTPTYDPDADEPGTPTPTVPATPDGDGITVQVLNGSSDDAVDDRVAGELGELGYDVVNIESASRSYSETTVFYSDGYEEQATELAGYYGWVVQPRIENLSAEVNIHVVVGEDEVA